MVTILPKEDDWADAFRQIGSGFGQGYMQRTDENAVRKSIIDLGDKASARDILDALLNTKTYGNEAKQQALSNYLGVEKFEELKRHAKEKEVIGKEKNRIAELGKQRPEDRQSAIANYLAQGFEQDEAEALTNPHVPNSVKQGISKRVENELAREVREVSKNAQNLPKNQHLSQRDATTNPNTLEAAKNKEIPLPVEEKIAPIEQAVEEREQIKIGKEEWPKLPEPKATTYAEKENWRKKNQDFNNKLLRETKEKNNSHNNSLIRYNRLTALNNSNKLPEGMGRLVINPSTGEPWGVASLVGLVNKETQNFVKTMNDFLIDAKNYFGSRVTNFDVTSFKSRLPTLLNTGEGRRLIIEQMKLMEELQIVHDKTLEDGLKHYGRNGNYSDIQNEVDNRIVNKEENVINKINNLDQASNYLDLINNDPRFKDTTLMQSQEGTFRAVPNGKVSEAKNKGYVAW